jgi:hypothetical protein
MGGAMAEDTWYRPVSRPYRRRHRYVYRRHVFDKLRALDLGLAEFQQLLGTGEVIAEAAEGPLEIKELVLLVQWHHPLHVVIAVDDGHQARVPQLRRRVVRGSGA